MSELALNALTLGDFVQLRYGPYANCVAMLVRLPDAANPGTAMVRLECDNRPPWNEDVPADWLPAQALPPAPARCGVIGHGVACSFNSGHDGAHGWVGLVD